MYAPQNADIITKLSNDSKKIISWNRLLKLILFRAWSKTKKNHLKSLKNKSSKFRKSKQKISILKLNYNNKYQNHWKLDSIWANFSLGKCLQCKWVSNLFLKLDLFTDKRTSYLRIFPLKLPPCNFQVFYTRN